MTINSYDNTNLAIELREKLILERMDGDSSLEYFMDIGDAEESDISDHNQWREAISAAISGLTQYIADMPQQELQPTGAADAPHHDTPDQPSSDNPAST